MGDVLLATIKRLHMDSDLAGFHHFLTCTIRRLIQYVPESACSIEDTFLKKNTETLKCSLRISNVVVMLTCTGL